MSGRVFGVNPLTRVEGEGRVRVEIRDDKIETEVNIFEPPRFFEAFLVGRSYKDVTDITARICGICPVAYQMSSAKAIENAFGVEVDEDIETVRRLLYCGEWIQSHALHFFLLALPDFFGKNDVLGLLKEHPDIVKIGLETKNVGDKIMALIGGRATHPISPCVGGFTGLPSAGKLKAMLEPLKEVEKNMQMVTEWVLDKVAMPELDHDVEVASLWDPEEYPMSAGDVMSNKGLHIKQGDFCNNIEEYQVPHSTAYHARVKGRSTFLVGPLSRLKLNLDSLRPVPKRYADAVDERNVFTQNIARILETINAIEDSVGILEDYKEPLRSRVPVEPKASKGTWITEAPRGMLYHEYELDASGRIKRARIIPPTAQNLANMEEMLKVLVEGRIDSPDEELAKLSGMLIRSYDPCISCSVHSLKIDIKRLNR
ncbi:MAG: Ni/Fe hydrogenase subunit alpha [Candidatus Hadarchaeota archaeon]